MGKRNSSMQKNEIKTFSNTTHKNKLQVGLKSTCKPDTVKPLEGNTVTTLSDKNHMKVFFGPPPRVTKINRP